MNAELLEKVRDHILAEPESLDIGTWVRLPREGCGTVACIAGWARILSYKWRPTTKQLQALSENGCFNEGRWALELTVDEAERLFFGSKWPNEYRDIGDNLQDKYEIAQRTADRIDFFIKTEGTDFSPKSAQQ